MNRRKQRVWVVALAIVAAGVAVSAQADMTLGVHPFRPATKLVESFAPLANYLSEKTGEKVEVRISTDYATHVALIGRDEVDIAYLGPAPYVELTKKYGKKPLLARQAIRGSPLFHGRIFVRTESPIRTLADLAGKRFVFGDPKSTMSSLVPQYMLWQAGVTLDKLASYKHVKDHVNATLAVLAGEFDGGAVKEDVFLEYEARGLRAIAKSPGISDHLFVARATLPVEKVELIREAMLTVLEEPNGSAIVGAITPGVTNLIQVEDRHYDNLRTILDKLEELGVAH